MVPNLNQAIIISMIWFSAITIAFTMGVYGLLHSWLASTMVKSWVEKKYPTFYAKYYRFAYSTFGAISLLPIGVLVLLLPDKTLYRIPAPWVFLTLLIQLVAFILVLAAFRGTNAFLFIGLTSITQKAPRSELLNTGGLYRFVRHPIYSLGLVIIWLFPWMTTNLLALFLSSSFYIFIGATLEERKLRIQFQDYAEYQKQVPMFIPRLHS